MVSALGNVLQFFENVGIYDVVLPFLLVFTIVYAIFERTLVLGKEKDGSPKKNLNAMVAFVTAFFVIASSQLVETITKVSSNMVVLLMMVVFLLVLITSFYTETELKEGGIKGKQRNIFIIVVTLGIIFIFMDAIKTKTGITWLDYASNYLQSYWTSTGVASVLLILFVIGFVLWLTWEKKGGTT